jgi:regulator of telomere elongation helicase 1
MRQLIDNNHVRNVLLTSGTLSPMDSFAYELQLPFQIKLENPHVISPDQVWIGVIDRGPAGSKLNSNYQNRGDLKMLDDLGNAIVNFARIVPDGLLVFFPSYGALNSSVEHWQKRGGASGSVWDRISKLKPCIVEPRTGGPSEFQRAMDDYDAKLRDPQFKGAAFFAVMRGKVSEGLDFSDGAGRAVVITGLPYPMLKDPKVK